MTKWIIVVAIIVSLLGLFIASLALWALNEFSKAIFGKDVTEVIEEKRR